MLENGSLIIISILFICVGLLCAFHFGRSGDKAGFIFAAAIVFAGAFSAYYLTRAPAHVRTKTFRIECWSGGVKVVDARSDGYVQSTDVTIFTDMGTGKRIKTTLPCVVTTE